ncbi:MAG: oxidoreductase [Acidobacteria bacterium]|nr:oxidoreductase [Acidobacteriota bacterium]
MLQYKTFVVREHVGLLKFSQRFDILDAATGNPVGFAQEDVPLMRRVLRLILNKKLLPTTIEIRESERHPVLISLRRKASLFRAHVSVHDESGRQIGKFRSKLLSLGGGFHVLDTLDQPVAEIKGDWKGWNFTFLSRDGAELGRVTRKWGGVGRELFTTAHTYAIALNENRAASRETTALLLAAGIAIDMVFKEG